MLLNAAVFLNTIFIRSLGIHCVELFCRFIMYLYYTYRLHMKYVRNA